MLIIHTRHSLVNFIILQCNKLIRELFKSINLFVVILFLLLIKEFLCSILYIILFIWILISLQISLKKQQFSPPRIKSRNCYCWTKKELLNFEFSSYRILDKKRFEQVKSENAIVLFVGEIWVKTIISPPFTTNILVHC